MLNTLLTARSLKIEEVFCFVFSFGYCAKEETCMLKPIGMYGNGFKSGSMRIGDDAIVFTKEVDTMSVGLLSQTYLQAINADTIYLPIVTWDKKTNILSTANFFETVACEFSAHMLSVLYFRILICRLCKYTLNCISSPVVVVQPVARKYLFYSLMFVTGLYMFNLGLALLNLLTLLEQFSVSFDSLALSHFL
jgi:hypothetical protein